MHKTNEISNCWWNTTQKRMKLAIAGGTQHKNERFQHQQYQDAY